MNFWNQLENKPKPEIESLLAKKLGKPNNELNHNLFQELVKKVNSYYTAPTEQNYTTYSLIGSAFEIADRTHKTGKNKGQTYYVLKLGGGSNKEKLHAIQANLPEDKWNQITQLAILGQNLVFKYKKWITNKQIIDFYPQSKK